ncbi:MAG: hypothetical protein EXX96DRAFT_627668 [Benjaminiella poitrasii]|nr:MAG: hypothetical protein EXX96DRAFT_627668 [Benjaminiella poitrasii]
MGPEERRRRKRELDAAGINESILTIMIAEADAGNNVYKVQSLTDKSHVYEAEVINQEMKTCSLPVNLRMPSMVRETTVEPVNNFGTNDDTATTATAPPSTVNRVINIINNLEAVLNMFKHNVWQLTVDQIEQLDGSGSNTSNILQDPNSLGPNSDFIRQQSETHDIKWAYKSCYPPEVTVEMRRNIDCPWTTYYEHQRDETPREGTDRIRSAYISGRPAQKASKKVDCKAQFVVSFRPDDYFFGFISAVLREGSSCCLDATHNTTNIQNDAILVNLVKFIIVVSHTELNAQNLMHFWRSCPPTMETKALQKQLIKDLQQLVNQPYETNFDLQ